MLFSLSLAARCYECKQVCSVPNYPGRSDKMLIKSLFRRYGSYTSQPSSCSTFCTYVLLQAQDTEKSLATATSWAADLEAEVQRLQGATAAAASELKAAAADRDAAAAERHAAATREADLLKEKAGLEAGSARLREELDTLSAEKSARTAELLGQRKALKVEHERATRALAERECEVRAAKTQVRLEQGNGGRKKIGNWHPGRKVHIRVLKTGQAGLKRTTVNPLKVFNDKIEHQIKGFSMSLVVCYIGKIDAVRGKGAYVDTLLSLEPI